MAHPAAKSARPSLGRAIVLLTGALWLTAGPVLAQGAATNAGPEKDSEALVDQLTSERADKMVELDRLQSSISLSNEKMESLKSEIEKLSGDTASLKQALVASAERRRKLEEQIGASETEIAKLADEETDLHAALNRERDVLADVLAALQRMGRDPPPALLVSPGDALDSVRSAILLNGVVPEMRDKMETALANLRRLQEVKQEKEAARDKLAADLDGLAEEQQRMDLLIAENNKASDSNAAELAAEQQQAEALAAKAGDLNGLIASLETDITSARNAALLARQEAEKRAEMTEAQKRHAREEMLAGMPDKNRISPAYPFSELKNRLVLPVEGEIVRQYGDPDGTGHEATGITIAARPGALVTAPADGTVVYAGRFRSYGEMVILNVGDGYHLVMTGMDGLKVHQGDFVFSGEPLADMGATRIASAATLALETDRPTLYIEFRQNGKPVDSHTWWADENDGKARNDT
ncbi:murein hydrolase activator EnvC family protein [Martelella endophytica]|uniref:Membrane protein n=1 Tax=Martelella endophytica TaxID=1486262 RepID=A0A0D5LJX5_MAREN|nr:murein hydrolase activator EnvC [Martelella endophytica]AJY44489.1 membrane protein [Martelella endophytica]